MTKKMFENSLRLLTILTTASAKLSGSATESEVAVYLVILKKGQKSFMLTDLLVWDDGYGDGSYLSIR
jgi:hypothetical protein